MTDRAVLPATDTPGGGVALARRPCPICAARQAEPLCDLHLMLQDGIGIPAASRVVACNSCGLVYQDGDATAADYEAFYERHSKYASSPTIDAETRILLRAYADDFHRLVPRDARILDIGCAGGAFLELLKQDGYRAVAGIDPSPECVRDLQRRGLEAHVGSVYGVPEDNLRGAFDLVILSGVMEHLLDPRAAVRRVGSYLAQGGMVFVTVPDAGRYHLFPNAMSYYFNFEHVNHFSPASMDNLMAECRFAPVAMSRHDIPFGDASIPVFAAYYRADETVMRGARRDEGTRASVVDYVRQQRDQRAREAAVIDELARSGEEIVIWGAGSVAGELLSATSLGMCRIAGFVDTDPGKQGKTLAGRPIRPPEVLATFRGTIVVCAAVYASDIVNEIRGRGLDNRFVVLK